MLRRAPCARRRAGVPVLLVLGLLGVPWLLGTTAAAAAPRVIVDDLGREVAVPDPVRRIVSLAPNLTEVAFALGVGDRLVGVTDFCDYPPAARRVARVGGVTRPSAERVLALAPDLVLATTAGNAREEVLALARLGLPVVVTDPADLESVARSFVLVARAAGVPEAGERLARTFRERLDAVRRAVAGRRAPRTLLLVWPDPLVAAGPRTFLSHVLQAAGGVNVLAGSAMPVAVAYPTVGLESLFALAPEAVVLAAPEGTATDALARLARYDAVPAVRDGRLATIDQNIVGRPGPRLAGGAAELARLLHGIALPERAAGEGPRP